MTTTSPWARLADLGRAAGAMVLLVHGVIHGAGTLALWEISDPHDLTYTGLSPEPGTIPAYLAGVGWLVAGALFVAAAALLVTRHRRWATTALAAAALSLGLALLAPSAAAAGITVDLIVAVGVLKTFGRRGARGPVRDHRPTTSAQRALGSAPRHPHAETERLAIEAGRRRIGGIHESH